MNWLRRIIPWAFEHDWIANGDGKKMRVIDGELINFLICARCGAKTPMFSVFDRAAHDAVYLRRGCRGAQ